MVDVVDDGGVGGVAMAAEEEEEEAADDGGGGGQIVLGNILFNSREKNELKSSIKNIDRAKEKIFDRNRIRKG